MFGGYAQKPRMRAHDVIVGGTRRQPAATKRKRHLLSSRPIYEPSYTRAMVLLPVGKTPLQLWILQKLPLPPLTCFGSSSDYVSTWDPNPQKEAEKFVN